jgi:hypothetical protein
MKKIIFLTVFILIAYFGFSQNVQFTASAPEVVEAGEQFEVTFSVNGQPSGFKAPDFKNFSVLGGPSQSTSSNVQIVNGNISQSTTISYTYYLQGNNVGKFTLEPAIVTVAGKTYTSNRLSVEVVKGQANRNATQGSQGQQGQQQGNDQEEIASIGNEDLFVRVLVDKNVVYRGDYIVATVKLYTRYSISSIEKVDYPPFTGFFSQEIDIPPLRSLQPETLNGKTYYTGVLKKVVLFPQQDGTLTIDPCGLECLVQQSVRRRSRGFFDDFFGSAYQDVPHKLQSPPVKIAVKPLPINKPASFTGAVGNYTFNATVDKTNVKSNDAITLKVTVSGNGNLKMIEPFDVKFPPDFDKYDPKVSLNAKASNNGVSGSKTFEYLVIPRSAGKFKIPEIEFTYFDPHAGQYKTERSRDFEINVEKSADEGSNMVVSGISKEDVRFIGKDIQFISTKIPEFRKINTFFFGSVMFNLTYLFSALIFVACILFWRKRIKDNANIMLVKNRKANKIAKKRLQEAYTSLKNNNKEQFYENVLKAFWGYVSDKMGIPVAELSRERVQDAFHERNIDEELVKRFMFIADECEFARYAPAAESSKMEEIYNNAVSLLSDFEQNVK